MGWWRRLLQCGQALDEGVEAARLPSSQEAGDREAREGTGRRARAVADLAHDDARAQATLGQIVIGWYAGLQHEREQLLITSEF